MTNIDWKMVETFADANGPIHDTLVSTLPLQPGEELDDELFLGMLLAEVLARPKLLVKVFNTLYK